MHTVGPGIWRERKITENEKYRTLGREIWRGKLKRWKIFKYLL